MASDFVYMLLALYKAATIWKETAGLTGARLMEVLVRDQAIYFLACVKTLVPTPRILLTFVS